MVVPQKQTVRRNRQSMFTEGTKSQVSPDETFIVYECWTLDFIFFITVPFYKPLHFVVEITGLTPQAPQLLMYR